MKRLTLILTLTVMGCFQPVPTENTRCPCGTGFECCAATQTCAPVGACDAPSGGGGGAIGGDAGSLPQLSPLPIVTDDVAPSLSLIRGLAQPAELRLVGETAYVLARTTAVCDEATSPTYPASVSRLEFVAGAWTLSWTTPLPVTAWSATMIATVSGVTIAGTGQVDGQAPRGANEAFVLRVNPDGSLAWSRRFATLFDDQARKLIATPSGRIVVAGISQGGLEGNTAHGSYDVFVAQLTDEGTVEWVKQFGSNNDESPQKLIALEDNSIVVGGWTRGELVPGATLVDYGFFLRKFDSTGAEQWTRQQGFSAQWAEMERWGAGFFVADTSFRSVIARVGSDGVLEWVNTSPVPVSMIPEALTISAIDADTAALHGLQNIPPTSIGSMRHELTEQLWTADAGTTTTAGLSGGWPRQSESLARMNITHRSDGAMFVAGSGLTPTRRNLFSLSGYTPTGGTRIANYDWFLEGPEYRIDFDFSDFDSTMDPIGLAFASSNAIVLLSQVASIDCPRRAGWLAISHLQP